MAEDIQWRGVTLIAEADGDGWRQSNEDSEWAVRETDDGFEAWFNCSYSTNGDWEALCEAEGATAAEALDESLKLLRLQLPAEVECLAGDLTEAAREFAERVREIELASPVEQMRNAIARADR